MEKAVEIKRRAQRCVQNGDLDGALKEYQKLVAADSPDPYNHVLIADLLYKKGDQQRSSESYLKAAEAYENAGLYKNGIAVCKKMLRLSLAPAMVLKRLATLHQHAGLGTESALYFLQYGEHKIRAEEYSEAADAFRRASEASSDNAKALERLAEVLLLQDDRSSAASTLLSAAEAHASNGNLEAARQCRNRAQQLDASAQPPVPGKPDSSLRSGTTGPPELRPGSRTGPAPAKSKANGAARSAVPERQILGDDAEPAEAESDASANGAETDVADAEGVRPAEPGLQFDSAATPRETAPKAEGLEEVEAILAEAQEHFRSNDREAAGRVLVRAAEAYEKIGSLESAASIYRSLAKSAQVSVETLNLWLANCEKREDGSEAARVAADLGDRAMADGKRGEAQKWFEKALSFDPDNEHAKRRIERLTGRPASEPAPAPAEEAAEAAAAPAAGEAAPRGEDRVELSVGRGEAVTFDLGSVISEFQRGVEAQLSGDAQSHYDLAMAYREMGLLEQAVEAFRVAADDPEYANRCAEMIGRCLLDQGRFEEAAQEFTSALAAPGIDADTESSLRFQLGLAYEAAGRVDEALAEFEGVYAAQPNYPDVALKIKVLRKSMESL